MPKMKTHKGAKKRFDITAGGKLRHAKGMKSHFRRRKAPRTKRMFDRMQEMDQADAKRVKRLLPNGL
jgi:large subunit ribosomal protein L35